MSTEHEMQKDSSGFSQQTIWVLLALVLLLAFGLRVARIHSLGTQADEGVFIALGKLLYEGKVLYRDALDNKPPGLPWLVASIFFLTKPNIIIPRLASVLATTLTCLVVYLIGKKTASPTTGLVAALFFALDPLNIFWSRFVMTEQFTALLITTSVYAFTCAHQTQAKPSFFLTGILIGWATLIKQPAFVVLGDFSLFLTMDVLLAPRKRTAFRAAALSWCALVGGLILAYVPALLLLRSQGVLADYIHFAFVMNQAYVGHVGSLREKLQTTLDYTLTRPPLIMALLSIPLIFVPKNSDRKKGTEARPSPGKSVSNHRTNNLVRLLVLWAVLDWLFFAYTPTGMDYSWGGFSHYNLLLTPSTSLLAAIFLDRCLVGLAQSVKGTVTHELRGAFLQHKPFLSLLLVAFVLLTYAPFSADLTEATWRSIYPRPDQSEERAIGEYVKSITSKGDGILIFSNAIIYYWADRVPASRYGTYTSFLIQKRSALSNDGLWEMVDAIQDSRTTAVIIRKKYLNRELRFPLPIATLLRKGFKLDRMLEYDYGGSVYIFTRKPDPDPLCPVVFPSRALVNIQHPLHAVLGDQLRLSGYSVHEASVKPGDRIHVSLFWEPLRGVKGEYTAFVHLRDQANQTVAQHDRLLFDSPSLLAEPQTEIWRYWRGWQPGEILQETHELNLPADMTPGEYLLRAGLYAVSTLERLPVANDTSGENAVVLGTITVTD